MDKQMLKNMENVDIRSVSKESLVDISDIKIDRNKDKTDRISDFIRQIKNPYCFVCNGIIVKMNFNNSEAALASKLDSYFLSL